MNYIFKFRSPYLIWWHTQLVKVVYDESLALYLNSYSFIDALANQTGILGSTCDSLDDINHSNIYLVMCSPPCCLFLWLCLSTQQPHGVTSGLGISCF